MDDSPMPAISLKSFQPKNRIKTISTALSASMMAIMLSGNAHALEDGFIGLYAGSTSSLDADSTSSSFKILTGAHVTSRISLEFGYVNLGTSSFDNPKAENQDNGKKNITFSGGSHGSVSPGRLGDATVIANGPDTYDAKDPAIFTGINEFSTHGGLINLRYRFPMSDEFDFFVKTGFFAWVVDYDTIKLTASQAGTVTEVKQKSGQTSAVNAISGAGFIYKPTTDISFRAELESTAISSEQMPRTRFQNISLGVNWEF